MPKRTNLQLARIFGIRISVSMSWFIVLFFLIYWLSGYFHEVLGGSQSTAYAVAVAGALGYFASLVLHELGHALAARRVGIPIVGIDLWFFGGLSQMSREPQSAGEELKVAAAGPIVTFILLVLCVGAAALIPGSGHARRARPDQRRRLRRHSAAGAGRLARVHQRDALRLQHRPRLPARRRPDRPRGHLVAHRRPQPRDARHRPLRPGLCDPARPASGSGPSPAAAPRWGC